MYIYICVCVYIYIYIYIIFKKHFEILDPSFCKQLLFCICFRVP